jgi:hypothetical protein
MVAKAEPTFIIPGLVWRFLKWISPLVFAFVAFSVIVGLGYQVARFSITGWEDPGRSLAVVFMFPAFLYAPIWLLATRRRKRNLRTYALFPAIVSAITFLLVLTLHYARPGPPQFDFLAGKAVTFNMQAATPGYFEWAYTFRTDVRELRDMAEKELRAKGYKVNRRQGFDAFQMIEDQNLNTQHLPPNTSASIYPGRAVGKSFSVDGDVLTIDASPGWVTVDVTQQDAYPLWLGIFIP